MGLAEESFLTQAPRLSGGPQARPVQPRVRSPQVA